MQHQIDITDRVVIVTGGSSGFGREICRALHELGAQAVNADVSAPQSEADAVYYPCDVTKVEDAEALAEAVWTRFGRIDALVNNAGINRPQLLVDTKSPHSRYEVDEATFRAMMDVDVKSVVFLSQAVSRKMIPRGRGVIVNISSTCGARGSKGQSVYAAAKAAVNSLTKSFALELGPFGIRVVGVTPGIHESTALNSSDAYLDALAYTRGVGRNQIDTNYADSIPLGRVGTLQEVADVVCYLISDCASYITGTLVNVSGGKTTD